MRSPIDKQVHINKLAANPALCMLPRLYNTITNPTDNYNKRSIPLHVYKKKQSA